MAANSETQIDHRLGDDVVPLLEVIRVLIVDLWKACNRLESLG